MAALHAISGPPCSTESVLNAFIVSSASIFEKDGQRASEGLNPTDKLFWRTMEKDVKAIKTRVSQVKNYLGKKLNDFIAKSLLYNASYLMSDRDKNAALIESGICELSQQAIR